MLGSSRTYAIGMAHYQMGGGWRSLAAVCGAYILAVLAGVGLYYYADLTTGTRHGMTSAAVTLILIVESIALVVFGSFRVSSAIRSDVSSQMIESHRLMPVPSWRAVTGYLLGPSAQTIAFALLNLVLVYVFAGITGTDLSRVTIGQATLFAFAILVWSACAVGTFVARYLVFIGLAALMPGMCVMYWVYVALPALALLTSPFIGQSIFVFTGGAFSTSDWTYAASFVSQAIFFGIFFAGACRRYRGTYPTTFSVFQAFLLLLAWSATTAMSMGLGDHVRITGFLGRDEDYHVPQVIVSLIAALLIAFVPIRTLVVNQGAKRSAILTPGFLAAVIAAIAALPIGTLVVNSMATAAYVETCCVAGAHVLTVYALLYLTRKLRPWIVVLIVGSSVAALWCVPLFLEVIRMIYLSNRAQGEPKFGAIGNFSPVGLLINVWAEEHPVSPIAGIIWQWLIALILGVIAGALRDRPAISTEPDAPLSLPPQPAAVPAITPGPPESAPS